MSDIRTRLADALTREMTTDGVPHTGAHLADVLLSLPSIAIVELPGEGEIDNWGDEVSHWADTHPDDVPKLAAALLAAAEAK